jgi:hypothetical protein
MDIATDIIRQGTSVSIVTDYGLNVQGSIPGRGKEFFSSPPHPNRCCGPLSFLFNGYWRIFPGVKQPERHTIYFNVLSVLRIAYVELNWYLTPYPRKST